MSVAVPKTAVDAHLESMTQNMRNAGVFIVEHASFVVSAKQMNVLKFATSETLPQVKKADALETPKENDDGANEVSLDQQQQQCQERVRVHICGQCGGAFSRGRNLERHISMVHKRARSALRISRRDGKAVKPVAAPQTSTIDQLD